MDIQYSIGEPSYACRSFLDCNWPLANHEIFGWSNQERWRKESFTLWCEVDGQILGVALFWTMGGVGYLSQLLVDKDHRGKGIGGKLVQAFEDKCRDCHKLALKTYKDSSSQKFYQGLGYQVEAVIENDVHGIDWVYMRKEGWS